MTTPELQTERRASAQARTSPNRWLLFVHQLPAYPSNLRVRTWRRLQQIGAVAVKQAVYVLPDSPSAREDFEWLKSEIEAARGQASLFVADTVDTWSHDALVEEFRRLRQEAYSELARDAEQVLRRSGAGRRRAQPPPSRRVVQQLRERLSAIERLDFFGSAGRDRVITLVRQVEDRTTAAPRRVTAGSGDESRSYRAQLWVTRPRPGVDRMASAWLIRHFIDPDARFGFVADRSAVPATAIPFDMFGVEFSHQGEGCTFETLCTFFNLQDPGLGRVAEIVHDLDLKDGRFGAPEAATVGTLIEGLQLAHADDETLLVQGMGLFDSLYRALEQSARTSGPRALAKRRPAASPKGRRASRRRRRS